MSMHFTKTSFGRGAVALQSRGDEPLSLDTIRQHVPAVFADQAHASRSSRFVPVPTVELLEGLAREGFRPFAVGLAGTGDESRRAFTSHMIRLRHANSAAVRPEFGRIVPEVIVTNANDGTAAYGITLGLFRFVCLNGLMVGSDFASVRVPHVGRPADVMGKVIEGTYTVVKDAPAIVDQAAALRSTYMPQDARLAFAMDAARLRWGEDAPVPAERLLTHRRAEDTGTDIWTTFNVLQENLMKGGLQYLQAGAAGTVPQRRRVRALRGLSDQSRINRALWDEATEWQREIAAWR